MCGVLAQPASAAATGHGPEPSYALI
jgi:hypothetical protein